VNSIIFASIISANAIQTAYSLQCASNFTPQSSNPLALQTASSVVAIQESCALATDGQTIVQSAETYFTGYEYWSSVQRTWTCTISGSAVCTQTVSLSGQPSSQTLAWTEPSAALLMKTVTIVDGIDALISNVTIPITSSVLPESTMTAKPLTIESTSSQAAHATSVLMPADLLKWSSASTLHSQQQRVLLISSMSLLATFINILLLL
jgi:hypothetical protein